MLKADPYFIPDAPERPERPRCRWSVGSMCALALVVCGLAWLTKFVLARDDPMALELALAATAAAALFGLFRGKVLLYAAWTFVLTVTVVLAVSWFVGLQQAVEYEANPTLWEPIPGKPGYFRNSAGEVYHP